MSFLLLSLSHWHGFSCFFFSRHSILEGCLSLTGRIRSVWKLPRTFTFTSRCAFFLPRGSEIFQIFKLAEALENVSLKIEFPRVFALPFSEIFQFSLEHRVDRFRKKLSEIQLGLRENVIDFENPNMHLYPIYSSFLVQFSALNNGQSLRLLTEVLMIGESPVKGYYIKGECFNLSTPSPFTFIENRSSVYY